jgi:hypothetical protein
MRLKYMAVRLEGVSAFGMNAGSAAHCAWRPCWETVEKFHQGAQDPRPIRAMVIYVVIFKLSPNSRGPLSKKQCADAEALTFLILPVERRVRNSLLACDESGHSKLPFSFVILSSGELG